MEYRMKDIMEPPKTLEEQKKEAKEAAAEFANKNCVRSNCFMCREGDKYETYRKCPFLPLKLIARERTVTEEDVPDNMG